MAEQQIDTNSVRRSIVAAGMARLNDDDEIEPTAWAAVASVVLRALVGHDSAQPPIAQPDALAGFLADVEQLANTTES
jgi:hypothetical protein